MNGSSCEVSQAEANACISAFEAAACSELANGAIPSACRLCEDEDAGAGTDAMSPTDGGLSPECEQLQSCCDTLSGPEQLSCQGTVDIGLATVCSAAFANFQGQGLCGGGSDAGSTDTGVIPDTGAPPDTGVVPDSGASDTGELGMACSTLAACCPDVPEALRPNCETVAMGGIEQACATILQVFQNQGYCM